MPVIVADECAAIGEEKEKKNGVLFRHNDVDDLMDKMKLFKDDGITKNMSIYAYDQYLGKHMSENEYRKKKKKVYAEML